MPVYRPDYRDMGVRIELIAAEFGGAYLVENHLTYGSLREEPDGTIWAGLNGGGLLQFKKDKFVPVSGSSGPGSTQRTGAAIIRRYPRLGLRGDARGCIE